jgi:hypothetical protein
VIRRFDIYEPEGRLLVARSRASALLDVGGLAAVFLLGAPGMLWLLSLLDDAASPRRRLRFLLAVAAFAAAAVYAFLVLLRAYRASRLRELLILDRGAGAITRGDVRLGALADLRAVELRRRAGRGAEPSWFTVALAVAGTAEPIPVGESQREAEMRACAARIASYAGVPVEER